MTWSTRKVAVQAGAYAVSAVAITEHFSVDGRFTIRRTGGMRYCSTTGFHGQKYNHWVWGRYELRDLLSKQALKFSTVAQAKRRAARLVEITARMADTQITEVN